MTHEEVVVITKRHREEAGRKKAERRAAKQAAKKAGQELPNDQPEEELTLVAFTDAEKYHGMIRTTEDVKFLTASQITPEKFAAITKLMFVGAAGNTVVQLFDGGTNSGRVGDCMYYFLQDVESISA
ncbi:hypothetical protein PG987_006020 [Apiospora arundinis]